MIAALFVLLVPYAFAQSCETLVGCTAYATAPDCSCTACGTGFALTPSGSCSVLVALYLFDDPHQDSASATVTAADSSGFNYTLYSAYFGNGNGGLQIQPGAGVRGGALYASTGTSHNYLERLQAGMKLPLGGSSYTIAAWVKFPTTLTAQSRVILLGNPGLPNCQTAINQAVGLRTNSIDFTAFQWRQEWWCNDNDVKVPDVVQTNTWYHVAITYDSSTATRYTFFNGIIIGYHNAQSGKNTQLGTGTYMTVAGSPIDSNYFNGYIDELAIFTAPLSQEALIQVIQGNYQRFDCSRQPNCADDPPQCNVTIGLGYCVNCTAGNYNFGGACNVSCPIGYYKNSRGGCSGCGNGGRLYQCSTGSGVQTGTACTGSGFSDTQTCLYCPPGNYIVGHSCMVCQNGGSSYTCPPKTVPTGFACLGNLTADTQTCSRASGSGTGQGDPHIVTLDGARYSYQGQGVYYAMLSTDGKVNIQAKFQPCNPGDLVTCWLGTSFLIDAQNTMSMTYLAGARLSPGGARVLHVYHNGVDVTDQMAAPYFVGGFRILRQIDPNPNNPPNSYMWTVTDATNGITVTVLDVFGWSSTAWVVSEQWKGLLSGLFGNFNGDYHDDLPTALGVRNFDCCEPFAPLAIPIAGGGVRMVERHPFVTSDATPDLRVPESDLTMQFNSEENYTSVNNLNFPGYVAPSNFTASPAAITACAGLPDDVMFGCLVDVTVTSDTSYAQAAASISSIVEQQHDQFNPPGSDSSNANPGTTVAIAHALLIAIALMINY